MQPAIPLPWKDDGRITAPNKLPLALRLVKDTASAFLRAPYFVAFAGLNIHDANRPWQPGPLRAKENIMLAVRNPHKRDTFTVWPPGWITVMVCPGIQIPERLRLRDVQADKAVVTTIADKCERFAVRRPEQRRQTSPRVQYLFWLSTGVFQRNRPYLSFEQISEWISNWRYGRSTSLSQFARFSSTR